MHSCRPRQLYVGRWAAVGIATLAVGLFLPCMCMCLLLAIGRQGIAAQPGHCPGQPGCGGPSCAWGMRRSDSGWMGGFGALVCSVLHSVRRDSLGHPALLGVAPVEGRWHVWPWTGTCCWGSHVPMPQGRVQPLPASGVAELGTGLCCTMCSALWGGRVVGPSCWGGVSHRGAHSQHLSRAI